MNKIHLIFNFMWMRHLRMDVKHLLYSLPPPICYKLRNQYSVSLPYASLGLVKHTNAEKVSIWWRHHAIIPLKNGGYYSRPYCVRILPSWLAITSVCTKPYGCYRRQFTQRWTDLIGFVLGSILPDALSSQGKMLSIQSQDIADRGVFYLIHIDNTAIEMRHLYVNPIYSALRYPPI